MRVRLKPTRMSCSVFGEIACRYSPVKNWFFDRNVRGNCG